MLCKHYYVNFVHRASSEQDMVARKPAVYQIWKPSFKAFPFPTRATFVQSVHAARNAPFFDLYVYRRERGVLCRFVRFPFPRRASPTASSPPNADAVSCPSIPFRSGASDASSPISDTHTQNAAAPSSGSAAPRFPRDVIIAPPKAARQAHAHTACPIRASFSLLFTVRYAVSVSSARYTPIAVAKPSAISLTGNRFFSIIQPSPSRSFKRAYAVGPHFISKPSKKVRKKSAGQTVGAFASG